MIWIIGGLIMVCIGFSIAIYKDSSNENETVPLHSIIAVIITFGMSFILISQSRLPQEYNNKYYIIKTEIRQIKINDQVTSSDTIYIITKNKK
jgi:hypothetical protein